MMRSAARGVFDRAELSCGARGIALREVLVAIRPLGPGMFVARHEHCRRHRVVAALAGQRTSIRSLRRELDEGRVPCDLRTKLRTPLTPCSDGRTCCAPARLRTTCASAPSTLWNETAEPRRFVDDLLDVSRIVSGGSAEGRGRRPRQCHRVRYRYDSSGRRRQRAERQDDPARQGHPRYGRRRSAPPDLPEPADERGDSLQRGAALGRKPSMVAPESRWTCATRARDGSRNSLCMRSSDSGRPTAPIRANTAARIGTGHRAAPRRGAWRHRRGRQRGRRPRRHSSTTSVNGVRRTLPGGDKVEESGSTPAGLNDSGRR